MFEQIFRSIQGNLSHYRNWDKQSFYTDLAINLGLGLVGACVAIYFWPGWIAYLGVVWALLNVLPVVAWVVGV